MHMANELDAAMKGAAQNISRYVKDAAVMVVETRYIELNDQAVENFDQGRPLARTIIKLDGDSESTIPMRRGQDGALEVDVELFNLHQRNVTTVIDYRARMLDALLGLLTRRSG
jgi:hypothetical protein